MQNTCVPAIVSSLKSKVTYEIYLGGDDSVEMNFALSHLSDPDLNALAGNIFDALKSSKLLTEPNPLRGDLWGMDGRFEEHQKFYYRVTAVIMGAGMARFEIERNAPLGIPYPIYEILARKVFEGLDNLNCLIDPSQLNDSHLLKTFFAVGEERRDDLSHC